jgi:CcmD family protein
LLAIVWICLNLLPLEIQLQEQILVPVGLQVELSGARAQDDDSGPGTVTGEIGDPGAVERKRAASRFRYLVLGYGLIWLTLGAYLLNLNRRIAQVGREIDDLTGRLEEMRRSSAAEDR